MQTKINDFKVLRITDLYCIIVFSFSHSTLNANSISVIVLS